MASFECIGFINSIKYLTDSVIVFVDEYKKGYRRANGTTVEDKYLSYKTIWKPYFKKYINTHFSTGMLVQVKGDMLPYAIEHDKIVEGYSVIGQAINLYSYPRLGAKQEMRMIKESQEHDSGTPDLEAYSEPDF